MIFTSGATEAAALALTAGIVGGNRSPIGCLYVGATDIPASWLAAVSLRVPFAGCGRSIRRR